MCRECRHNPCVPACPNYNPPVIYECDGCGEAIYARDNVFITREHKHYCHYCCYQTTAQPPEPDEDLIYESWRDRKWEQEHDD